MNIDITYELEDGTPLELVCDIDVYIDNDGIGAYDAAGYQGYDTGHDYIGDIILNCVINAETDEPIKQNSSLFDEIEKFINSDSKVEDEIYQQMLC